MKVNQHWQKRTNGHHTTSLYSQNFADSNALSKSSENDILYSAMFSRELGYLSSVFAAAFIVLSIGLESCGFRKVIIPLADCEPVTANNHLNYVTMCNRGLPYSY